MVVWKLFPGGSFRMPGTTGGWLKVKRWSERKVSLFDSGLYERFFETPSEDELIKGLRIFQGETQIHEIDWTTKVDQDSWATHVWVNITDDMRIEYSVDMPDTRVYGYFNDVNTLVPIQGVQVTIGPYFTYSDVNGFYSLSGLFGTEFDVKAEHPNYQTLYVHPESVENFVYRWDRLMTPSTGPPVEPGITITGQVLDKDNNVPILDALVRWGAAQTTTDSSGRYTLTDVVPGAEWLTAYAADRKTESKPMTTPMTGTVTQDFELEKDIPPTVPTNILEESKTTEEWHVDARKIIDTLKPFAMLVPQIWGADVLAGLYETFWHKDPIAQIDIVPSTKDYNTTAMVLLGAKEGARNIITSMATEAGNMITIKEVVNSGVFTETIELNTPTVGGIISVFIDLSKTTPNIAGSTFVDVAKNDKLGGLWRIFLPIRMLQELNVVGWERGWLSAPIYKKIGDACRRIGGSVVYFDGAVRKEEFDTVSETVASMRDSIKELKTFAENIDIQFFTGFGWTRSELVDIVDGFEKAFEDIIRAYPAVVASIEYLPDILIGKVTYVIDGDTIELDDTYRVRLAGIDAHEIGTKSGFYEWNRLQELIFGQTVTVKIGSINSTDKENRISGVVFKSNENINLRMLAEFGEYMLPETKNRLRHKYVDWDENLLVAQSRQMPVAEPIAEPYAEEVGELHITSSPTYAKIYLDGVDTGLRTAETLKNIPAKDYTITLQAVGYDAATTTASVEAGRTTEVDLDLVKQPVPAAERKPSRTTLETHFKDAIISEADARSGLADLGYTANEVDNFLSEWILELKQYQIMEIYLGNVATKERVMFYLNMQGYTDADIDGLIIRWDEEAERRVEQATMGNIGVTSEPQYADVYIDGDQWAGVTPMLIRGVSPGTHTVKCQYYGYDDKEITVTVLAGKEATAHLILTKKPS